MIKFGRKRRQHPNKIKARHEAAGLIERHGLYNGREWLNKSGRYCLVTSVSTALGYNHTTKPAEVKYLTILNKEIQDDLIRELHLELGSLSALFRWSDAHSKEEVLAALRNTT